MILKRVLGIVLLTIGIILYFFSSYISSQVAEGKEKISSAKEQVNVAGKLFSMSPYTKGIGKEVSATGEKKIGEGEQKVAKYEKIAHQLYIGGIILVVLGAGVIAWSFAKRTKKG